MSSQWIAVATFEVDGSSSLSESLKMASDQFAVRAAPGSPSGFAWYDIVVDSHLPAHKTASITCAVLRLLQAAHERGELPGYRVVVGEEYLRVGAASTGLLIRDFFEEGDVLPADPHG
jgi:hypothetical protein